MSSKSYSSKSFRSDKIYYIHHTGHGSNSDVEFGTNGNHFNYVKPIRCTEYIINDKFKIIEDGDKLIFKKNDGAGNYSNYFIME